MLLKKFSSHPQSVTLPSTSRLCSRLTLPFALIAFAAVGCNGGGSGVGTGDGGFVTGGGDSPSTILGGGGNSGDTPPTGTPPPTGGGGVGAGGGVGGGGTGGGDGGSGGGGGGGGDAGTTVNVSVNPGSGRTTESFSGQADSVGRVDVRISVLNSRSFQSIIQLDDTSLLLATLSLTDPSGAVVLSSNDNVPAKTDGLSATVGLGVLPYPTSGDDPAVITGTYTQALAFSAVGSAGSFNGAVIAKNDSNLNAGTLRVNIFRVGNDAQSGSTKNAIDSAISTWRSIYAAVGISLGVQLINLTSDTGIVPSPFAGSDFYLTNSGRGDVQKYAVNVYLGSSISSDGSTNPGNTLTGVLGLAPQIPGPGIATRKSGVALSLLAHEGADGNFSAEETTLLAETMAHEVGHYLGLYHPVECANFNCASGSFASDDNEKDSLGDTAECTDAAGCISSGVAANLMFPVPIGGVATQQTLTANQGTVINLQAIVD